MLYGLKEKDRIFTITKSYLHHEMDRGARAAGVKRIRIHDLRHSHISLLIDMGFRRWRLPTVWGMRALKSLTVTLICFRQNRQKWQTEA